MNTRDLSSAPYNSSLPYNSSPSCNTAQERSRHQQKGIAFYFILGLILTIITMIALVVELPQQEALQVQAKMAADAAALAAVSHLDGTLNGWEKAAIVATQNLETNLFINSAFNETKTERSIELGFAHMTSDPDGAPTDNQFESFVKVPLNSPPANCNDAESCLGFDLSASANTPYLGARQKTIANAVRVTVSTQGAGAVFGKVAGVMGYGDIKRSAVSLVYDQQEFCVAPLAIPACALFLDTDPNHYGGESRDQEYLLDDFDPVLQSGRELIFTEASPWKPWTYHKRAFGLNRHLTYHRPPLIRYTNIPGFPNNAPNECGIAASTDPDKKYPNCRADAIFGVLGAPGKSPGDIQPISPTELADFFTLFAQDHIEAAKDSKRSPPNISTCSIKARFGAPFRPLENAVDDSDGLLTRETSSDGVEPPKKTISRALQTLMPAYGENLPVGSTENFKDTFYYADGKAKANIPLTRRTLEESIIRWPPYDKVSTTSSDEAQCSDDKTTTPSVDERTNTRILLKLEAINQPGRHIKPLAHPANSAVVPEDRHGVKEVLAMVIGPTGPNPYCDYPSYLEQRKQENTTPHHQSAPRIIGFVKVILVDYNFSLYNRMGPEQRSVFINEVGEDVLPDRNPIGIEVPSDATGINAPEHHPYAKKDPAPWKVAREGEGEGDPGNYVNEPTPTPNPNMTAAPTPTPLITAGPEALWDLDKLLEYPPGSGKKYRPKKYQVHPLPLRRFDCEDPNFEGRCHYLQDHPAQYGLGGITAALSIDLPMPLFGPQPIPGVTHPILIAVKE